ncbi:MAG: hypothetical protein ACK4JF_06985 [Methylohalobius sp.]
MTDWLLKLVRRIFPTPQAIALTALLALGFLAVVWLSDMLIPVFAALVIAYLLGGIGSHIGALEGPEAGSGMHGIYGLHVMLPFSIIALLPLLFQQLAQLV